MTVAIIIAFIVRVFIYKPLFKCAEQPMVIRYNSRTKCIPQFKQIYYVLLLLLAVGYGTLYANVCILIKHFLGCTRVRAHSFRLAKFRSFPTADTFPFALRPMTMQTRRRRRSRAQQQRRRRRRCLN